MSEQTQATPGARAIRGITLGWCLCLGALLVWLPSPVQASAALTRFGVDAESAPPPSPPYSAPVPMPRSMRRAAGVHPMVTGTSSSIDAPMQYSGLIRSQSDVGTLDSGLMGESIDYDTGRTDFVATDVSLPGNFDLPMAVGRVYHVTNQAGGLLQGAFGDWDMVLPRIEGVVATSVGWTVPQGGSVCSNFGAPPTATVTDQQNVTTTIPASEYSTGYSLVLPGAGRHELLLRAPVNPWEPAQGYPIVTRDWWIGQCTTLTNPPAGTPSEGFAVTSPRDVTYTFINYSSRPYPSYQRPADTTTAGVMAVFRGNKCSCIPRK